MGNASTLEALQRANERRRQQDEYTKNYEQQLEAWRKDYQMPAKSLHVAQDASEAENRPREPRTQAEWLLAAARQLGQPFSETALILAAWGMNQQMFGLKGCEQYHPDSHKVRVLLCGKKSLVAKGLLVKVGDKYRVKEKP